MLSAGRHILHWLANRRATCACARVVALMIVALAAPFTLPAIAQQAPRGSVTVTVAGSRELIVEATFPALPDHVDAAWTPAVEGAQRGALAGVSLPAFTRELSIAAERVELISVETIEQHVGGVRLEALADAPITGDSARDRALAARLHGTPATGRFPATWAEVADAGRLNDRPVSVLTITPYRVDVASGAVETARRLKLRVRTSEPIDRRATESLASAFRETATRAATSTLMSAASSPTVAPDGFEYKIFVERDGVYRLYPQDLREAGIPLDQVDARTLKLHADGIEQPLLVVDRGDHRLEQDEFGREYIEFFGERRRARNRESGSDLYFDPYARHSVYFLSWGGSLGKRIVEESGVVQSERIDPAGDLTGRGSSFVSTIHLEEDQTKVLLANAELNTLSDRFDRRMWGSVAPNEMKTFPVVIPHPNVLSQRRVEVRAAIRSALRNSERLDAPNAAHEVEVFIDGFRAIAAAIPTVGLSQLNSRDHVAEPLLPGRIRTDQKNVIAVSNRRGAASSEITDAHLNWVEITYPRFYIAAGDSIEFTTPPQFGARYATFRIRGFTSPDIRVYRRGVSRVTNLTMLSEARGATRDTSYDVQFQVYVASESERFYAVTERNIRRPVLMRDAPSDLASATNAADYLVIVDDVTSELASYERDAGHPLRRFIDFKRRAGFTPKLVRASDIYDEFNGGAVSPFAIRAFLAHAWRSWSVRPRYAMIFAAGTPIEPRNLTTTPEAERAVVSERSYVPTIMLQTVLYGATECDYLLGCVDGEAPFRTNLLEGIRTTITDDLIAEIIVGRLPLTSRADIETYVEKLIDQETYADNGDWRNQALLIGGWEDVQGYQLMQITNDYARFASEPHRFIAAEGFSSSRYRFGAERSIIGTLSSGVGMVTYLGHGGGGQWEETAELNLANASSLQNRRRMGPVLSLTCFTGAYDVKGGLIGRLLTSPNGGAIQAFATPGFGWLRNNGLLADAVFSVMHNPRYRGLSFGEILTLGKALYVGRHLRTFPDHVPTVAAMYTIFGDPSLRPPYARDTVALAPLTQVADPGARIAGTARLPFTPNRVDAVLFDTTEIRIAGATVDVQRSGGDVTLAATVPAGYAQPFVGVRLYASDDAGRSVTGSMRLPTGLASVSTVRPATPLVLGSDAVFEIEHGAAATLDTVWMTLRYDDAAVFSNIPQKPTMVAPGLYRTAPIAASQIEPGATIDVRLPSSTVAGTTTRTFRVEGGPDPAAFPENAADSSRPLYGPRARYVDGQAINATIAMAPTAAGPRLVATIYNWGDRDAAEVPWRVTYDSADRRVPLGSGVTTVPARSSATVNIDVGVRAPVERVVRIAVDPDTSGRWTDGFRDNNGALNRAALAAGMVRSGVGFTVDGTSAGAFTIPGTLSLSMSPADAPADGVVAAIVDSAAPASEQRWRLLRIGSGAAGGMALRLMPRGIDASTNATLTLTVSGESTLPEDARIVGYDSTTRLWMAYPSTRDAGPFMLSASVPAGGVYAVARVSDNIGPRIRFAVEGQFFLDSSAVPADARFSAVLFDESGIDTRALTATLDGEPLELGRDVVWLDSTITASSGSVRVQKPVSPGSHTLCITAADRVGNTRRECTSFQVDGELSVRLYGNFPNPFSSETFIAYEIRGATVVDEIELKIFSTSGRLVRTFRFPSTQQAETQGLFSGGTGEPTSLGYHEAWWDGRDDLGREVANGVYFYRLRVSTEEGEVEELGTLARIR